ncbi:hypothetical protein BGZ95_002545 [Linnemannia exigua]|uniref:Uncharacterized protein n=1 Tax=Linnemannia exigua TaxID=604196 RepID=A0AAD4H2Z8_9FUNG|nr:hypothetical protein BGZ95_002545 [Linnemannia exigua]
MSTSRADCENISLNWFRHYINGNDVHPVPDPVSDLHSFELIVATGFNEKLPKKTTIGNKKNNYHETRKAPSGLWSVEHSDSFRERLSLTVKGKKHTWDRPNRFFGSEPSNSVQYWACVTW